MSQQPQGDDTVIDAEIVDAGATPDEVTAFLTEDVLSNEQALSDVEGMIRNVANISKEQLSQMSGAELDTTTSRGFEHSLAMAEMQIGFAKYGQTPTGSVDGLLRLREGLVAALRDKTLLPKELQVRAQQLTTELEVVQMKHEFVIQAERNRTDVTTMATSLELARAELNSRRARVEIKRGYKSIDIDEGLIDRRTRNERLAKQIESAHELRRVLWRGFGRGIVKWVLIIGIPLFVAANLIADDPARHNTPVFGLVNNMWDGMYMPIRDGITRSFHLDPQAQSPSPSSTVKPTKPKPKPKPKAKAKAKPKHT